MSERAGPGAGTAVSRTLRASLLTGAGTALPALVFVISSPWLLSKLGADRFGALALLTAVAFLSATLDGGVGASLPRFLALTRGGAEPYRARELVCTGLLLSVAASVLLGIVAATLGSAGAHLLRAPEDVRTQTSSLAIWLGLLIALQLVGATFQSVLVAYERFGSAALSAAVGCLAYVAALILLVPAHGLAGAFFASAARAAITLAVAASAAIRLLPGTGWRLLPSAETRELLSYAWRTQIGGLAMLVNAEADTLVVATFLPLREAAAFSLAVTVSTTVRSVPLWAMPYLLTRLSVRTALEGPAGAAVLYNRVQRVWAPVVLTYAVVTLGVLVPAVSAWLGPGHSKVALIAVVLSTGYLVNLLSAPLAATARATGHPGLESRYGVVAMVVNIGATVPLAITAGSVGVALGTALGCLVGTAYFARLMADVVQGSWARLLVPDHLAWSPTLAAVLAVAVTLPTCLLIVPGGRLWSAASMALVAGTATGAAAVAGRAWLRPTRGNAGALPAVAGTP